MTLEETLNRQMIVLPPQTLEKLSIYHALLCEWNEKIDLTNVPPEDMPLMHYADSLIPLFARPDFFKAGASAIDVGTGAGLPGIPLAIARPDMRITLLDAQQKRCDFLQEAAAKAGLSNVTVLHARAEDAGRDKRMREKYDLALARAVAPLSVLLEYLLPFVKTNGYALAYKGPAVIDEWQAAAQAARILGGAEPEKTDMPLEGMRHLLVSVKKIQSTVSQYPRKSGTPSKKPLGVAVEEKNIQR